MNNLSRFSSRYIENLGMSFGIKDVTPSPETSKYNLELFSTKNRQTIDFIKETLKKVSKSKIKKATYKNLTFE